MKTHTYFVLSALLIGIAPLHAAPAGWAEVQATSYFPDQKIYQSRPDPARDTPFGCMGATGLMTRVYPGVIVKVEGMMPGSPAEGKFTKGEIIRGINGVVLRGLNPFVACGEVLTRAEATDGQMVFDVASADEKNIPQGNC
jgi:hypothetical protein